MNAEEPNQRGESADPLTASTSPSASASRDSGAAARMPVEVHRLIDRMKRIEGQARGVQRMLEEGRPCEEVITQLVAMREAISRVAMAIVASHMEKCLVDKMDLEEAVQRTTDLMLRLS